MQIYPMTVYINCYSLHDCAFIGLENVFWIKISWFAGNDNFHATSTSLNLPVISSSG